MISTASFVTPCENALNRISERLTIRFLQEIADPALCLRIAIELIDKLAMKTDDPKYYGDLLAVPVVDLIDVILRDLRHAWPPPQAYGHGDRRSSGHMAAQRRTGSTA